MSKRSKRSSVGRNFANEEENIEMQAMLGFAVAMSAFQLATKKLAALEPSKTAQEWEECVLREVTEQVYADETAEMFETQLIENTNRISSRLSNVVKIAR